MRRLMFRAKIHRAVVTEANLHYEGSLSVDETLMDAAGFLPYEQVQVANIENGERFETYLIPAPAGSGMIGLNGAAARKGNVGDRLIIMGYAVMEEEEARQHKPIVVLVDEQNRIREVYREIEPQSVVE